MTQPMDGDEAAALIDRLTAGLPDTAPPIGLASSGHQVRRRRRHRTIVVTAVVVALLTGGVAATTRVAVDDQLALPRPAQQVSEPPFPAPPPGTTWIGKDRVVVAVPTDWLVTDLPCGEQGAEQVAVIDPIRTFGCALLDRPLVVVRISDAVTALGSDLDLTCDQSRPQVCSRAAVPLDSARVTIGVTAVGDDAPAVIDRVLDSAMVLPDGWTTVPAASNTLVGVRQARYEAAGFDVTVKDRDRIQGARLIVEPPLGAPIELGGTITLSPDPDAPELPAPPSLTPVPATAAPGQEIEVRFSNDESVHGFTATLTGNGATYGLISAGYVGRPDPSWQVGAVTAVRSMGLVGPLRLVVPDVATPGTYRLCVGPCTTITVTR